MFRLYDTRTGQLETIEPARRGLLRMYSCGPDVGRRAHAGDLRSYLPADLIRRNAEHRHHLSVLSCELVNDLGHPAQGEHSEAHGEHDEHGEEAFRADCSALNLRPAEHSPRASEGIDPVIDAIARLIEAGHAYPIPGGSVYFDARSFASYGALPGNRLAGLRPGGAPPGQAAGTGAKQKRFHADWALWEGTPADREPAWPAPWGTGVPARHAACSALSLRFLGDVIDIQTGGVDLLFPQHEDERAQSDSLTGHEVVRHWLHGEHLLFDGHASTVRVADLTTRGLDPLALRLAFLEHRYRQQMNLTWDSLGAADLTLRRWREQVAEWACSPSKPVHGAVAARIAAAFDDDLDTPAALRSLRQLEQDPDVAPGAKFESFAHADQLLGLDLARDVGRPPARPPEASGQAGATIRLP
jgi:cysteinyl-tRNA synthetase